MELRDLPKGQRPRVIILDRGENIDDASGRVLRYLIPRLAQVNAMLVLGYARIYPSEFMTHFARLTNELQNVTNIELPLLTTPEVGSLVRELTGRPVASTTAFRVGQFTGFRRDCVLSYCAHLSRDLLSEIAISLPEVGLIPQIASGSLQSQLDRLPPLVRLSAEVCALKPEGVPAPLVYRIARRLGIKDKHRQLVDDDFVISDFATDLLYLRDPLLSGALMRSITPKRRRAIHQELGDISLESRRQLHRLVAAEQITPELANWVLVEAEELEKHRQANRAIELLATATRLAKSHPEAEPLRLALGCTIIRNGASAPFHGFASIFDSEAPVDHVAHAVFSTSQTIGSAQTSLEFDRMLNGTPATVDEEFAQAELALERLSDAVQANTRDLEAVYADAAERWQRVHGKVATHPILAALVPERRKLLADALYAIASMALQRDHDQLLTTADSLLQRALASEPTTETVTALGVAAALYLFAGEYRTSAQLFDKYDGMQAEITVPPLLRGRTALYHTECRFALGEIERAEAVLNNALGFLYDQNDFVARSELLAVRSWVDTLRGQFVSAKRFLDTAEADAALFHTPIDTGWIQIATTEYAFHTAGAAAALQQVRRIPPSRMDREVFSMRACLYAAVGNANGALAEVRRMSKREHELGSLLPGRDLIPLSCAALANGEVEKSIEYGLEAVAKLQHPYFLAHAHHRLAVSYQHQRNGLKLALQHLNRSRELYTASGAIAYLDTLHVLEQELQDAATARVRGLTVREQQVAALVAKSWTNKEIARELNITPATVAYHVSNLLTKLDLTRRTQIADAIR